MRCPYCSTINREDRVTCYHCGKDLGMLRLVHNRARHHYNSALEHAERGRTSEAIAEARSALQLDGHLTEARLLLGTLHARLHRTEEAREEWLRLLAENPDFQRAHQYLDELPQLQSAVPLLQRLRLLTGGFAVVAALLVALALWFAWPSREARLLDRAWAEFAARDLAASTETLQRLPRPLRDSTHETRALALEESIDRLVGERLALIQDLTARGEIQEALGQLRRLRSWELPGPASETLLHQENLLRRVLEEQLARLAAGEFTTANMERLLEGIEDAALLFPAEEVGAQALADLRRTGDEELQSLLLQIDAALLSEQPPASVELLLERAMEIAETLDEGTERVAYRMETFSEVRAADALARAERSHAAGAHEETLRILRNINDWPPEKAERAGELRERAAGEVARVRLERVRALLRERQWDDALAQETGELLRHLSPDEAEAVRAELVDARRRQAAQLYYARMRDAGSIEAGELDPEEARALLRDLDRIRDAGLPGRIAEQSVEHLLFFEAAAHAALEERERVHETLERLRAHNPRSPYLLAFDTANDTDPTR